MESSKWVVDSGHPAVGLILFPPGREVWSRRRITRLDSRFDTQWRIIGGMRLCHHYWRYYKRLLQARNYCFINWLYNREAKRIMPPKLKKLRTAGDVINRLRWSEDELTDESTVVIGFWDGVEGWLEKDAKGWISASRLADLPFVLNASSEQQTPRSHTAFLISHFQRRRYSRASNPVLQKNWW